MAEKSNGQYGGLRRLILYVFPLGWLATIAIFALLMRAWIPDVDLKADLAAIEEADTNQEDLDGPLPPALQPLTGPPPAFPVSGSVYVPLYSSLYVGGHRSLKNLSATLSLRNTSADQALVVTSVAYFDENGKAVVELLDVPHVLAPMATAEFYTDQSGTRGGPFAAVTVGWGAETSINPPLIEAVILGNYGAKSISFVSRGENHPQ
jgi:hypothetical protein